MYTGGVLEVHDNVVFEANTAEDNGGAVSLQSLIRYSFDGFLMSCLVGIGAVQTGTSVDLLGSRLPGDSEHPF